MHTADGNAALEFHDSELTRLQWHGTECVLEFDGYVHRSAGVPGVDSGTGWSQRVVIRCTGVRSVESVGTLPTWLYDGSLARPGGQLANVIPVPSSFNGPIRLELLRVDGERIAVHADAIELTFDGEPTYVEEFQG